MKTLWLSLASAALFLVGCAPDRTLDTLIPRNALVVVLVDHPALAVHALGTGETLPLKALETGKPWAAAVVPANPPGFVLALALSADPSAWDSLERWARDRGGLNTRRVGTYGLLYSPGLPEPGVQDPDRQFDLSRVRAGGDPLAVYVDVNNVAAEASLPEALRPTFPLLPWAQKNLSGLRIGFAPKDGGLELRLASDWRPGSSAAATFRSWTVPADPSSWASQFPSGDHLALVASLPASAWAGLAASIPDPNLARRWAALAPMVGPRVAVVVQPDPDALFTWTVALEAQDPQAVRQALRTLVAGGDLQKSFAAWALDSDTPLIYRDGPTAEGIRGKITLGALDFQVAFGGDKVVFSGGPDASEAWGRWRKPAGSATWTGQVPTNATAVADGSIDGLGAKAAVRVLGDGNVEARVWADAAQVKAWEERLPQALLGWLSGEGGWTRWEP